MAPNIGLEGLLPFAFMSLTTHIILSLRLPIFAKDLFLLCAYTAIWTSRTRLHIAYLATTHRFKESFTILPEVAVEVARAFYDQTLASSFYALIWVLIWGPTTGLAILARFALGIAVFACTVCYFTATTPLKALLWVPAWYCVVQPTYSLSKRAAKGFLSGVYHCVVSPRARSFCGTLAAAGLSGLRSGKASGVICMQYRPRLSVLVRWVTAVGAACGSVGRAVLSDICQAASEGLALYRWTAATTGTLCCCAASRVYARILYMCCLPGHAARCVARGVKKSVIFFRDEPGTVECLVVSIAQFCEEAKCTSDVLTLVPFAALAQGKLIPSGSSRCARAFTASAIKTSANTISVQPQATVADRASTSPTSTSAATAYTGDHMEAVIHGIASLTLCDAEESLAASPSAGMVAALSPCDPIPPLAASVSCDSTFVSSVRPLRGDAPPFVWTGALQSRASTPTDLPAASDSPDATVCDGSSSSLDSLAPASGLPAQADPAPVQDAAEDSDMDVKPKTRGRRGGKKLTLRRLRQKHQDAARVAQAAMIDTVCAAAAALQNAGALDGEDARRVEEQVRAAVEAAAAEYRAWKALIPGPYVPHTGMLDVSDLDGGDTGAEGDAEGEDGDEDCDSDGGYAGSLASEVVMYPRAVAFERVREIVFGRSLVELQARGIVA